MVLDTHNTPTTSGFDTLFDNGATILAQGGLPTKFLDMPGHQIFGATYSSGRYVETATDAYTIVGRVLQGLPPVNRVSGSWSLTYAFDQTLWIDPCDAKRSWGLFGGAGLSDGNPNPIKWFGDFGFAGSSPIAGRKLDTFGIAYYYMGISDGIKNLAPRLLPIRDEHAVELFYNIGVTPWCHVTPDVQVVTPARDRFDTSLVLGLRVKLDF